MLRYTYITLPFLFVSSDHLQHMAKLKQKQEEKLFVLIHFTPSMRSEQLRFWGFGRDE
jgi:hypothetical protein